MNKNRRSLKYCTHTFYQWNERILVTITQQEFLNECFLVEPSLKVYHRGIFGILGT